MKSAFSSMLLLSSVDPICYIKLKISVQELWRLPEFMMGFPFLCATTFPRNPIPHSIYKLGGRQPSSLQTATSVQFSSVAQSCLCDPTNCSTPRLPVHHQLPEFTQTHVHRVGDAIQPSHALSSPSSPAPNPSQHQSFPISQLFTWGGQSTGVSALASFLPKNTQDWSP